MLSAFLIDFTHDLFADIIAGGNLAFMCYKIKAAIDKEQQKTVWVPSGSL